MNTNQTVIGSYQTEEEAERVVRRLLEDGYQRDDITIFTNLEKDSEINPPRDVNVANPDMSGTDEDFENDKSFWQSLKDAFKVRDGDYYEHPNYTVEDDFLHMYRDDIRNGNLVIAVSDSDSDQDDPVNTRSVDNRGTTTDSPAADHPSDTHLETLGTTAGFPTEGAVQGMGDGGQPPLEPRSNEGVPPELEDTRGEANTDEVTSERLEETRRQGNDPKP